MTDERLTWILTNVNLGLRVTPFFAEVWMIQAEDALREYNNKKYSQEEIIQILNVAWGIYRQQAGDARVMREIRYMAELAQL